MSPYHVLIIGAGGREHALASSIKKSPQVKSVYCAPGNDGMCDVAEAVAIDINSADSVLSFIENKNISLTVIGPEAPLVAGLSDALRAKGKLVVGASRKAAQLEGSKIFAKEFMAKYGIPTARYKTFESAQEAKKFALSRESENFRVLKADGLAAGKGVFVTTSKEELVSAITSVMEEKKFAQAGDKIIIEETLTGPEISIIALTDGSTVLPFPASQDHKRLLDQDRGPNTGGMGAYCPTPFYTDAVRMTIQKQIFDNFIRGLEFEKLDYKGFIYFGLILTKEGPKVLEFNVRFGDPEAQAVLPLIDSDLYDVYVSLAKGELNQVRLQTKKAYSCTVVLASQGYPETVIKGAIISGLDNVVKKRNTLVFHAGTKRVPEGFVTNGGRVLNVTGLGTTLESAVVRAYQGVKKISFEGMQFRSDIAARALRNKSISRRIKSALRS